MVHTDIHLAIAYKRGENISVRCGLSKTPKKKHVPFLEMRATGWASQVTCPHCRAWWEPNGSDKIHPRAIKE